MENKKIPTYTINTQTEYFAKKNTIFSAITFFKENSNQTNLTIEAIYPAGVIITNVTKMDIDDYLGYDFINQKEKFRADQQRGGKLYHKNEIMKLWDLINNKANHTIAL